MTRVCVYAIAGVTRVPVVSGSDGRRLILVRAGRLSAIVGPARRVPSPSVANLRRYHETISRIAEAIPAILPARFGTVMDDAELGFILRARSRSLAAALKHVRGRVQVTLRIAGGARRSAPSDPHRAQQGSRTKALKTGTAYLRSRADASARDREIPGFAPVRSAVAKWVRDERVTKHAAVTSVYHLVTKRSLPAYARALSDAARAAGIVVAVSGPFPPYAFADPALI